MIKSKDEVYKCLSEMSKSELVETLKLAGFNAEIEGKHIVVETEENVPNKDINPAIAYTIVKDMIVDREDEASMTAWDYLYELCLDECTHTHIDGSSSWSYPYEDIDHKICDYCSWN